MSEETREIIELKNFEWEKDDDGHLYLVDSETREEVYPQCAGDHCVVFRDRMGRVTYDILPNNPTFPEKVYARIIFKNNPHITEGDVDRLQTHIECHIRGLEYTDDYSEPDDYSEENDLGISSSSEEYDESDEEYDSADCSDDWEYESS